MTQKPLIGNTIAHSLQLCLLLIRIYLLVDHLQQLLPIAKQEIRHNRGFADGGLCIPDVILHGLPVARLDKSSQVLPILGRESGLKERICQRIMRTDILLERLCAPFGQTGIVGIRALG